MQVFSLSHDMRCLPYGHEKVERMTCDADSTGTKTSNVWHATPTVRTRKSRTYGMRHPPNRANGLFLAFAAPCCMTCHCMPDPPLKFVNDPFGHREYILVT
ncbi:hypothetical protein AVEN_266787-1 [Araneus ventricosus]|uniref:Uncharacterized protein n=1 Tax=Araneus ventricosus TaxID=182803 RepID=A0A4Y2GBJ9_ARAVE|nr:hypothetical protein AVEN_266787-1 [Araneus ventricosus]